MATDGNAGKRKIIDPIYKGKKMDPMRLEPGVWGGESKSSAECEASGFSCT